MTGYNAMLMGHLLCFGYWLGADLGVFYSSRYVVNSALTTDARRTAAAIMHFLDLIPRICLVLVLPFGLSMATALGLIPLSGAQVGLAWAVSLAWAVIVTVVYYSLGKSLTGALKVLDWMLRFGAIFGLLAFGYLAWTGEYGFVAAPWLALKCALFATVIFSGVCIRWAVKGMNAPFGAVMQGSATDADEAVVHRAISRARPFVLYIWLGVFVIGWIGLSKPSF